jgi:hypothetical protein
MLVRNHRRGYPFGERVPKAVRIVRNVCTDFGFIDRAEGRSPLIAANDETYPAWTNSYGAVAAVFPDGRNLGLCPGEFQVAEWHEFPASPQPGETDE